MLLLVCVLVATVTADVTHTTLKSGQCLCVHGGGVNARDHRETAFVIYNLFACGRHQLSPISRLPVAFFMVSRSVVLKDIYEFM